MYTYVTDCILFFLTIYTHIHITSQTWLSVIGMYKFSHIYWKYFYGTYTWLRRGSKCYPFSKFLQWKTCSGFLKTKLRILTLAKIRDEYVMLSQTSLPIKKYIF